MVPEADRIGFQALAGPMHAERGPPAHAPDWPANAVIPFTYACCRTDRTGIGGNLAMETPESGSGQEAMP